MDKGLAMKYPSNSSAWAIGSQRRNGFYVRRVVWGLLMAWEERREGEEIREEYADDPRYSVQIEER